MNVDSQIGDPGVAIPAAPSGVSDVVDELAKLLAFAREALSAFLELVSLETRRAGLGLLWMLAGGLAATILVVTAWAGVMAALGLYIVSIGMHPIAAVIVVAALNLIAGVGLIYWCIGLSRHLLFTATRRQLAGDPLVRPSAP